MLVLSRKKNQSILIEGGIEIEVLQLKGGSVKIGIQAPDNVRIIRGELEMFSSMFPLENDPDSPGQGIDIHSGSQPDIHEDDPDRSRGIPPLATFPGNRQLAK